MKPEKIAENIVTEFTAKEHVIQVLLANGDGSLKRKLHLYGDYKEHRKSAVSSVYDDAFYLTVAVCMINSSWILRRRFQKLVKKVDKITQKKIEKIDTKENSCNSPLPMVE
jgi:hypothetical protein